MSFPPPHLLRGAGEVPSGRPRTFCGVQGSTQWPPPCLLRGAGRYTVAAPAPSVGGSGGREGRREGAMERGIVTASLCWSQPHSQIQGAHRCPLGFVSGAAASTNLLSQFSFPLLPPCIPPSLRCPRTFCGGQ